MIEIDQVAVVFQTFLKIVAGENDVEVARFRRVRQLFELPEPAITTALGLLLHDRVQQGTRTNALNGTVNALGFLGERTHRGLIIVHRLRVRAQLGKRVRHRQIGFLHRRVEQIAIMQLEPRIQRRFVIAKRFTGPADSQQRLAGIRSVQSHSLQRDFGFGRRFRLQQRETQRKIGFVAQIQQFGAVCLLGADRRQYRLGLHQLAVAHQSNAQVESRVRRPVRRPAPGRQQLFGFGITPEAHQYVRVQVLLFRLKRRRQRPLHFAQRLFGALQVAAGVPDFGQVEPGAIAHASGYLRGQQLFEARTRLVVHAELQIQTT